MNRPNKRRSVNGPADELNLPNLLTAFRIALTLMNRAERLAFNRRWRKHCAYFNRVSHATSQALEAVRR